MNKLDQAISIAIKAHSGQIDKAGQPYILHPLRIMFKFRTEDEMIVAVMHDVIEDSNTTSNDLINFGFSTTIVKAINCLTRMKNESYDDFISNLSKNDLATRIKVEDIKDNLDLTRLDVVTDRDLQRVEKYHRALMLLTTKDD